MQIDITTQEIWHFIGSFQHVIEAARGRTAYDAFRAQQFEAAQEKLALLNGVTKAVHKLADFAPGVQIGWQETLSDTETAATVAFPIGLEGPLGSLGLQPLLPLDLSYALTTSRVTDPQGPTPFLFEMPAPSSAVVMAQDNWLTDQDIHLGDSFGVAFTPFSAFDGSLQGLLAQARSLDKMGDYSRPLGVAELKTTVWQVGEDMASVTAEDGAVVFHGQAANGLFINGERVTELPKLKDHLPDLPEPVTIKPDATQAEIIAAQAGETPAYTAIAGGNSLVNEVTLTVSWLDAPVMLVQGDVVSLSVISQINVLSEFAITNGGTMTPSQVFNLAEMATASRALPDVPAAKAGEFPQNWLVTTLNADLINVNWMDQANFVLDHDVLSLTWQGASSFLRLGDNSLVNLASLLEIGLGYDLVVIGGDMISLSMIRQMNVLLDADWVATGGGSAQISAGGNLLWNSASITGTGIDNVSPMSAMAAAFAAEAMKGNSGAIPHAWSNPAFEGVGTLKVLYITGDYLTVTMISQSNVLGDADQVAAMAGHAGQTPGAAVQIHTGSNALVNLASIHTGGLDSEIQVGGDFYSDALLYQANFIDADAADPYGANGQTALASEAVLFLADGMLTEDDASAAPSGDMTLNNGHLDGVNAVLA